MCKSKMPEARVIDLNGDTLSTENKEAQSPLKSENSQPKRRSPLQPCKLENVDDVLDTSSQPRQGGTGGPSTNGSDTKSKTKSSSDKFLEALESRFRSCCEVRLLSFTIFIDLLYTNMCCLNCVEVVVALGT